MGFERTILESVESYMPFRFFIQSRSFLSVILETQIYNFLHI